MKFYFYLKKKLQNKRVLFENLNKQQFNKYILKINIENYLQNDARVQKFNPTTGQMSLAMGIKK